MQYFCTQSLCPIFFWLLIYFYRSPCFPRCTYCFLFMNVRLIKFFSIFLIYSTRALADWICSRIHAGLNWQSRCAVFPFENSRVSYDDATWQGDDLHRKGTTPPVESNRVAFVFLRRDGSRARARTPASRSPLPPRPRRIIESLVKPPHANTLFLSSCPSSSLLFLLFACSFSIGHILFSTRYHLRTLAATLSRTLHILPLPYQVLLDSPLLTALYSVSY